MIRAYRGVVPKVASSAYIDPSAQVIGDVEIGADSSVWPLSFCSFSSSCFQPLLSL